MAQTASTALDVSSGSGHGVGHLLQRAGSQGTEGVSAAAPSPLNSSLSSSTSVGAPILMSVNGTEASAGSTPRPGFPAAHGHLSSSHPGAAVFFTPNAASDGNAIVAISAPSSLPSVSLPLPSSHVDLSQLHPALSQAHGNAGANASSSSHLLSQIGASSLLLLSSPGPGVSSSGAAGAKGTVPGASVGQGILFPQAGGATLIANPGSAGPSLVALSSAPFSASHPHHAFLAGQGQPPAAWVVDAGGVSFSGPFAVGAPVSGLATGAGALGRRASPQPSPTAFSSSSFSFHSPSFQAVPTHEGGISALAAAIAAVKVEPNAVAEDGRPGEARDTPSGAAPQATENAMGATVEARPPGECTASPTHMGVLPAGSSSPTPVLSSMAVSSSLQPGAGLLVRSGSGSTPSFASAAPHGDPNGAPGSSEGHDETASGSAAQGQACLLPGDGASASGSAVLLSPTGVGSATFEGDMARAEGAQPTGAVSAIFDALNAQCRPGQGQGDQAEASPAVFFAGRQDLASQEASGAVQAGLLSTHPSSQQGLTVVPSPILSASFPSFSSSFTPFPSSALTAVTVERLAALAAVVAGGPAAPGVAPAVAARENLGFLGGAGAVGDTPDAEAAPEAGAAQFAGATGAPGPEGSQAVAGKRPRGRPRGSKNKFPRTANRPTPAAGTASADAAAAGPVSAGPGVDAAPSGAAGPQDAVSAASETAETGAEASADATPAQALATPAKKRRAGVSRKKKTAPGETTTAPGNVEDSGAPGGSGGLGAAEPATAAFLLSVPSLPDGPHDGARLSVSEASGGAPVPPGPETAAGSPSSTSDKDRGVAEPGARAEAPGPEGPACGGSPCGAKPSPSFATLPGSCGDVSVPALSAGSSGGSPNLLEVSALAADSFAGVGLSTASENVEAAQAGGAGSSAVVGDVQATSVVLVPGAAPAAGQRPAGQKPQVEPAMASPLTGAPCCGESRSAETCPPLGGRGERPESASDVSPPLVSPPVASGAAAAPSPGDEGAPAPTLVKADAGDADSRSLSGEALAWRGLGMIKAGGIRKSYSASFKLAVVAAAEGMSSNTKAAKQMGVTESLVRRWRMQKAVLEQLPGEKLSRRGRKHGKYVTLEQQLCLHVCAVQQQEGRILKDTEMRRLASEIAGNLAVSDFKASSTWCFRFKRRWGLDRVQNTQSSAAHAKRHTTVSAGAEASAESAGLLGKPGGAAGAGALGEGDGTGKPDPKKTASLESETAAVDSLAAVIVPEVRGEGEEGGEDEGGRDRAAAGLATNGACPLEPRTLDALPSDAGPRPVDGEARADRSPPRGDSEGDHGDSGLGASAPAAAPGEAGGCGAAASFSFSASVATLPGGGEKSDGARKERQILFPTQMENPGTGTAPAQSLASVSGSFPASAPLTPSAPGSYAFTALPSPHGAGLHDRPGASAVPSRTGEGGVGPFPASFSSGALPLAFLTPALSLMRDERKDSANGDEGPGDAGHERSLAGTESLCLLLPQGANQAEQELALQQKLLELQRQQEALEREIAQHRMQSQAFQRGRPAARAEGEKAEGRAVGDAAREGAGLASLVGGDGTQSDAAPEAASDRGDTPNGEETSHPGVSHAAPPLTLHASSPSTGRLSASSSAAALGTPRAGASAPVGSPAPFASFAAYAPPFLSSPNGGGAEAEPASASVPQTGDRGALGDRAAGGAETETAENAREEGGCAVGSSSNPKQAPTAAAFPSSFFSFPLAHPSVRDEVAFSSAPGHPSEALQAASLSSFASGSASARSSVASSFPAHFAVSFERSEEAGRDDAAREGQRPVSGDGRGAREGTETATAHAAPAFASLACAPGEAHADGAGTARDARPDETNGECLEARGGAAGPRDSREIPGEASRPEEALAREAALNDN
ncbi:cDNA FLJ58794, highly similar to Pogo transposable element with KRAB domain, related [Neospora caninum Liverpool]|uniref:Pogo transposable element with KRAB domain, related n=1 Tax=Neospora caninum (strain Liverpool) TaxID=572307 RepID=F0VPE7_NEOCL|nr:cDNA FLJ58794, highly similar to Pogo transposable element with KRAB domain, related [Neospora caninum Liverpool]CBZ55593.1 cDNA FLJ58794, highly similar to Pogo transposable element with KRAB domain, related [Neospora caninum Liverpool]CEL70335.1 TPA: Pogo transposable element with KRAB domain, related [Neospora caninum Liverpool]|eukprot:XP_003885621.1 cDNA FLJ58794, highly similar to Pogo transposable element with KRAB domain, related [Neospora caninum Liverpool]